jgi:hypothetical protein
MGPSAGGVGLAGGIVRTITNSFTVPDIRKKLAFTAAMLLLYRIGAYIPAPGINTDAVESISVASNIAGWSSPVAREAHNLEVAGSNPVPATNDPRVRN